MESEGIGYDFMLPANDAVRPADSSAQSTYNFYLQLLEKARNGSVINHYITVSSSTVEMQVEDGVLTGEVTVTYNALRGGYEIDEDALPDGVSVSGYTGESGDVLTFTIPVSMAGETISLTDIFIGYDNRCAENVYWLDDSGSKQSVVVPVVDTMQVVATGSVTLKSEASTITVTKYGESENVLLKGVVFGIYDDETDELIEKITTNSNSKAESSGLSLGDYYIKELSAPNGYVVSDEAYSFSVTDTGQELEVSFYNDLIKGKVEIYKTGENGEALEGAVFGVYDTSGNLIQELTTDEDGYAFSGSLVYGDYYVKEITAPDRYALSDEEVSFSITENKEVIELNISNILIRGTVSITKQDEDENLLPNAVFGIYDTRGNLKEELTTDENGYAQSTELDYGYYYIKEISAPEGYVLDTEEYAFSITESSQSVEITVTDCPITGKVKITKEGEKGEQLPGAVFSVYDAVDNLLQELTTSEEGSAVSDYLEYGDYYIKEITAPDGYILNDEAISFSITVNDKIYEITVLNTLLRGNIQITKTDEEGNLLGGAVFGIYDYDDNLIEQLTTDETGTAQSSDITYGDYYIKEVTAPIGYVENNSIYAFSITEDGQTLYFDITNQKILGYVEIQKSDSETGEYLEGAELGIYTAGDVLVETIITDCNGYAISSELEYGNYYVKETEPPEGYILNEESYTFSISNDNEVIHIDIVNDPIRGNVEIVKTDSETGELLSGAVFGIYDDEDNLIEEIVTDSEGYAISISLLYGNYYLKEIAAPEGYIINEGVFSFSIEENNQVIHFDISDDIIKGQVQVTKTEPIEGNPLEGVVFGIYDIDGILLEELTTDDLGIALSSELDYSNYSMKEICTIDGYILDDTEYTFSIYEDEEIVQLDITNAPVSGSVEVFFRHVDYGNELYDSYVYSDWVGMTYMEWIEDKGIDCMELSGYTLVSVDYPDSEEIIDGKLIITYWYDEETLTGSWSEVAIPKTGQKYPWKYYIIGFLCIALSIMSVIFILLKRKKEKAV